MTLGRREFMALCGLSLGAAALRAAKPDAKRPNLLLVFPDQMRAQAQGFMGMDRVRTPVLDAFAAQSRVFTQAISNYPVCSPFRAILMSGALPKVSGVVGNCRSTEQWTGPELRKDIRCWSDVLADAGYDLCYIGKWHLDAPHRPWLNCANNRGETKWNEWCPPSRRHGFAKWYAYGTYDHHLRPLYWDTDAPREDFRYVDAWGPEHEAGRAEAFLKETRGPFALVVSMNPPHTPYDAVPARFRESYREAFGATPAENLTAGDVPPPETHGGRFYRSNIRDYLSAVEGVDAAFGRILKALRESGHEDDTVVVFCSDHGSCLGAHGLEAKNNFYEESVRIPCMIRWPGKIAPAMDGGLTDAFDLAPTLLGLLGQPIPETMAGRNLAPYLLGEAPADLTEARLYMRMGGDGWDFPDGGQIPLDARCDTVLPASEDYGWRGLRDARYTFAVSYPKPGQPIGAVLHDRQSDPKQQTNLAAKRPELTAAFRATLKKRLEAIGDPFAGIL